VRVGGLLGFAAAGLIGASTMASAAAAGTPIIPQTFGPSSSAAQTHTTQVSFSCGLPTYGGDSTGVFNVSLALPRTATVGSPVATTAIIPTLRLPQSALKSLAGVDNFAFRVDSSVTKASVNVIHYTASAAPASTPPSAIPSVTATATVTFLSTGTAYIADPARLVITPSKGGTAMTPITCGMVSTVPSGYPVTVTAPVTPTPPPGPTLPGPVYNCFIGIPGLPTGPAPITAPLPMMISAAGSRTTGSTDTVTLSSRTSGLGGPYPQGTTALSFSGSLPVTGVQHGSVVLRRYTKSITSSTFRVSGPLYLTNPGTDHILFPNQFTFTIFGPKNPMNGKPLSLVLACRSKASTVALTLKVTGKPAGTGGTGGAGGTAASGAVPAGAPNTGGGPRPGSDLPLAVGGAALVLVGGGFVVVAARRRRGQPVS
jgi:hypothetical protein